MCILTTRAGLLLVGGLCVRSICNEGLVESKTRNTFELHGSGRWSWNVATDALLVWCCIGLLGWVFGRYVRMRHLLKAAERFERSLGIPAIGRRASDRP